MSQGHPDVYVALRGGPLHGQSHAVPQRMPLLIFPLREPAIFGEEGQQQLVITQVIYRPTALQDPASGLQIWATPDWQQHPIGGNS